MTIIISCSENDSEQVVTPIETENEIEDAFEIVNFELEIEVFENGGILLEASANEIDTDKISEYGFLLSLSENPNFENSLKFEPDEIVTNKFYQTIDNDLDFNSEYYVVAYAKPNLDYSYTQIKSFVSTGSKAPQIQFMDKAHIGDTINIKGINFSEISNRIRVLFDEEAVIPLASSDTTVTCVIPKTLKRFDPKISVNLYNKSGSYEDFSLYRPTIQGLSKNLISIGDTLTVYGKHFDYENERNSIRIEEKQSEILSSTSDSITFVLPQSLSFSNNTLTINSQLQEVDSESSFALKPPVITEVPLSFRSYETIEIMGDEFSSIAEDNIVLFDGHQAKVIEASKTKLKVIVPIGPYANKNPILQIKIMDHVYQFEDNLEFIDTWLLYKELPENYNHHFVSNDDTAYIFIEDDTNARYMVKTLGADLNQKATFYVDYPRTSMRDEHYAIIFNEDSNRAFLYFAEEEEHNFYEFLLDTKTFVERSNYPDTERSVPATFTIDGMIYMGLGNYPTPNYYPDYEPFSHFWRYDDQFDSWTRVADFPGNSNRRNSSVFVIDNEGYLGNGATTTGHYQFWKYSPLNNEWIRVDNFPDARKNNSYFEYNGSGYVVFGNRVGGSYRDEVFKYVPVADDWLELERVNEYYYNLYGLSSAYSVALKFSNTIYVIVNKYPNNLCFKADLEKL